MISHTRMQIIQIIRTHVNTNLVGVQCHMVESHIAERAIAEISWLTTTVARPDEHIMGVGHGPVVHWCHPTTVGLTIVINTNLVIRTIHHKCKVHPLPCWHRDTRINRQSMTRCGCWRIKSQGLSCTTRAKELIPRAFTAGTLHRHIAFADIAWITGIGLVAHPPRDREALVGSDVEVFVMRDTHVLVSTVESDVMGRLGKCPSQSRQQNSESK